MSIRFEDRPPTHPASLPSCAPGLPGGTASTSGESLRRRARAEARAEATRARGHAFAMRCGDGTERAVSSRRNEVRIVVDERPLYPRGSSDGAVERVVRKSVFLGRGQHAVELAKKQE